MSGGGHFLASFRCFESLSKTVVSRKTARLGFTLAEVLITLGIIGVVAALTMPALVAKYRNLVYVTRLKKAYSTLENGFKKMLADDEVQYLSDTTAFNSITKDSYYGNSFSGGDANICPVFNSYLKKYFKIVDIKTDAEAEFYTLSNKNKYKSSFLIMFEDGSMLRYLRLYKSVSHDYENCEEKAKLGGKLCVRQGDLKIDVNGMSPPNKLGRDIFNFVISEDGRLFPEGGKDYAYWHGNVGITWRAYYWTNGNECEDINSSGDGCAGRIMEKGWIMDY